MLWTVTIFLYIGVVFYSHHILISIGQDEETSYYTQQFLVSYVPALFLWGLCDLFRRYLGCFKKTLLPMMSYLISISLHPLWCHIFVKTMDMRLYGIAYAGLITNSLNLMLIIIFISFDHEMKEAIVAPDRRVFLDLKLYLSHQIPNTINLIIDLGSWEQMTLISGYFGILSQASQVILIYLLIINYTSILGM